MPRIDRIRRVGTAALAVLTGTAVLGAAPAVGQPFTSDTFLATHNSYSGDVDGAKGSIAQQLDRGVRFVEFDVHDNGYATTHDYGIGHGAPGDLVDHTGNPASDNLRDWLAVVNAWSAAHPTAAPIVVMLDLKDDLTDNQSYAAGNLAAVNAELWEAFGPRLLTAPDYRAGATTDSLRGKVLTLLSGDRGTRASYRRDVGEHPAVALNGHGQVVEVHDSGAGALWYWTGSYGADGRITWHRHGRYDSGRTPAVALDDSGRIVEVHQSQNAATLWYRTGQLGTDGEISWSASHQYDNGMLPTVAVTGDGVREIHRSAANDQNWQWRGSFDASGTTIDWTDNAATGDPRYDAASAASGTRRVRVTTGAEGPTPARTLRYSTDRVDGGRVRYPQVAFDEYQHGDPAELQQDALFYGAPATESTFIEAGRDSGHLVRGWDFDSAALATDPPATYAATNHPYDAWYQDLTRDAVR
ncbi:PI-PLC domain-containing protein [Amycolatopsis jiangsuensis]|uniref:Calcium-dependent phosphoinositide phospholipase C n=1 Tax=Amycolatopsis jiangsuensis TaxID=1181879 RepID=A0A840IPJ9_9PSEU|nr:hypothetical protein [Amycolatopsis jiangsuensis]MBB4683287.1 hypothetical protein [Amycolatopsis jiangsuensis]